MVVTFLWCVQEVAGLKEEDLPSENTDPPTAAGSSSTLSESQYTHVHKLCQWYSSIQVLLTCLMSK